MKTIGILGGMGPRATVVFEQMLLDRLPGGDQQLPTIVTINDGAIPDRSQYLLGRGPDPLPRMQRNVQLLESAGADIICLPCNTACTPEIFGRLRMTTGTLLNLPELVVRYVGDRGARNVCLLATEGTVASATYQRLCEQSGICCTVPEAALQRLVTGVIATVKRGSAGEAAGLASSVAERVALLGCDMVILGCTELPLVTESLVPAGSEAVDTLAVLADACVRYSKSKGETYGNRRIHNRRKDDRRRRWTSTV